MYRNVRLCSCTTISVLLYSAPAGGQVVEGCYDLRVGAWDPTEMVGDSIYYSPPARVRLSPQAGRSLLGPSRGNAVEVVPGAMPSIHPEAWWRHVSQDSIEMVWTTGFTGLQARLAIGDTLRGTAKTFIDVVPATRYQAPFLAVPVSCDAPLEPSQRLEYRYTREIVLSGNDTVRLGEYVPSQLLEDSARANVFRLRGAVQHPFSGASRIEVTLDTLGRAGSLRLLYPEDVTFDALLDIVTTELGAPTNSPRGRLRVALWGSRTETVSISQENADPPQFMIVIRSHIR